MADPNRPHLHPRTMEVHRLTPYGCTWFDEAGQPYAVVPAASYDHCLVVRLARGHIPGTSPGWLVGLSEGEGQEAAQAWWVGSAAQPSGRAAYRRRELRRMAAQTDASLASMANDLRAALGLHRCADDFVYSPFLRETAL
jgi:hypothetical protein